MFQLKLAVLPVLAVALAGCATISKDAFLHDGASLHRYERPLDEVLVEAKKVLEERGYVFRAGFGEKRLASEWKEEMGSSTIAASYSRYLVEGFSIDDKRCQIRVHRQTARSGGASVHDSEADSLDRSNTEAATASDSPGGAARASTLNVATTTTTRSESATKDYAAELSGKRAENATVSRDLQIEWLLMQRLAPEDAQELQQVADAKFK